MNDYVEGDLTRLVLEVQAGNIDLETAVSACSLFVFRRLQRNWRIDEDSKQDFFIAFLPYVRKIIAIYDYQGLPFEHFLIMIMNKRIKTFINTARRERYLQYAMADASLATACQDDGPAPRPVCARLAELWSVGPDGRLRPAAARKWFLVWMLKHSPSLEEADIELTARLTGVGEDWVRSTVRQLGCLRRSSQARLEKLRQRRNRLFVGARLLEMRIRQETDEKRKAEWDARLRKKRASLLRTIHLISRILWNPSHRMVAEAAGIPKGTVDIIIYRIQRLIEARSKEESASIA